MILKQDEWYPRRMVAEISKVEFNIVISMLESVSSFYKGNLEEESKTIVSICNTIAGALIEYSKFDTLKDVVIVSIYPKELGLLMSFLIIMIDSTEDIDYFDDYVFSGEVFVVR